jgi:mono/diheme cytochrome c family protein
MNLSRFLVILIFAAASFYPTLASAADKNYGASLFAENGCQHCHTIRKNGGNKGPDLSGVGRSLSKNQIRTQILQGGHEMPAFADILKESEVNDLVAYLHSCRDKNPK